MSNPTPEASRPGFFRRWRTVILVLSLVINVFAIGALAAAGTHQWRGAKWWSGGHGNMIRHIVTGLPDNIRDELRSQRKQWRKEERAMHQDMHKVLTDDMRTFATILRRDEFDRDAFANVIHKAYDHISDAGEKRMDNFIVILTNAFASASLEDRRDFAEDIEEEIEDMERMRKDGWRGRK